jgi:hypothetical protein
VIFILYINVGGEKKYNMIDNFDIIKAFIKEHNPVLEKGDFFFLQVVKRKKDNPEMTQHEFNIDNFYLNSFEDFDKKKERIVRSCEENNARCLIRLEKRNYEKLCAKTIGLIADAQEKKQFHVLPTLFLSACGKFSSSKKKFWMVDVDDMSIFDEVKTHLESITKIHAIIPSKSGCHIIITGFKPDLWKYDEKDKRVELKADPITNIIC